MVKLWLFVRLAPEAFERARESYGATCHIGREMPREIPKSWTYISQAWNGYVRTPVTKAIENAAGADNKPDSVTFHLYREGKGVKNNKKPFVDLRLPKSLDNDMFRVAALVKHFTLYATNRDKLYNVVNHQPAKPEIVHILRILQGIVNDLPTKGLCVHEIYRNHVVANPAFAAYTGSQWEKWFIKKLEQCLLIDVELRSNGTHVSRQTPDKVLSDANMIRFLHDLSTLVGPAADSSALLSQWASTLETCSSPWCHPPLWWCIGTVLVGSNLDGMTRALDHNVRVAATWLGNWDMFPLLKLLQSNAFSERVKRAAWHVQIYARTDIAHERFDCDWHRDWTCMYDLLHALGCEGEGEALRDSCEPKFRAEDGGARVVVMAFFPT